MFGFGNKQAAAVEETFLYLRAMVAGLGEPERKPVPVDAFADPYVAGFLQVLTLHAVASIYHGALPNQETIDAIMAAALDKIIPGHGVAIVERVAEIASPTHQHYADYSAGRRDGSEHVRGLLASDEVSRNQRYRALRDYVTEHYLQST